MIAVLKKLFVPVLVIIAACVSAFLYKGAFPWNVACFVAMFFALVVIRSVFEVHVGRTGKAAGTLEQVLLVAVFLGTGPIPFLFIATPVFAFADYAQPVIISLLAILVGIGGLLLFYRSHIDLDRQWSVSLAIQEDHRLVDTGAYRWMRHPMYSALFLIAIAQAGFLPNWFAGFSGFVSFALLYAFRIAREEALMASQFGDAWLDYAKRTPRLVPLPWRGTSQ